MNQKADAVVPTKHRLPLSSRQVIGGGALALEFGVTCPRRGHYTPVAACIGCDACEGIVVGETETDNVVLCAPPDEEPPAASGIVSGTRSANVVTVAEIMTPHVFCARGDLSVRALGMLLDARRISSVPVVDALSRPLGIVSRKDVLQWFTSGNAGREGATIADIMTHLSHALPANESVARAAAFMAFEHLQALPVVAPSGQVIGVVSAHDILAWVAHVSGYVIQAAR